MKPAWALGWGPKGSAVQPVFPSFSLTSMPGQAMPPTEAVKETFAFIRAHSTIRFVMLPFVFAALALLAEAFYLKSGIPKLLTASAALLLSTLACVLEIVLSRNLIVWWRALERIPDFSRHWPAVGAHRDLKALRWARWALFLPYPFALAFWVDQMAFHLLCCWGLAAAASGVAALLSAVVFAGVTYRAYQVWGHAESGAGPAGRDAHAPAG